jgi:3D (Asp-Asp-Asp) domain-containing protein
MHSAQIVVNVMLVVAALSPTHYHADARTASAATVAATSTKNTSHRVVRRAPARQLSRPRTLTYTVTATAYQAVPAQTDNDPFVTADNSRIRPHYSSKTRWLAISQDLLAQWGGRIQYGDKVRVRGISRQLDGVYTVHDTMNKRYRHCVDILTHPREKIDVFTKGVKLQLMATNTKLAPPQRLARSRASQRLRTTARQASRPRGQWLAPAGRSDYFASAIL